jgi:ribosomal protein S18 acetylase RimI-like enzyme
VAKDDALLGLLPDNPLAAYALPCILPLGDKTIAHLRTATGASLGVADRVWALRAVERALRPMYDRGLSSSSASASASSLRWSATEKRRELRAPGQRFLLVQQHVESTGNNPSGDGPAANDQGHTSNKARHSEVGTGNTGGEATRNKKGSSKRADSASESPLGFISFRADLYDEDICPTSSSDTSCSPSAAAPSALCASTREPSDSPTQLSPNAQRGIQPLAPPRAVYVYELFIAETARGRGIGQALMRLLEEICRRARIFRIVLTVFHENHAAMRLYKQHLGYVVDRSSPCQWGVHDANYEILSKWLPND